MTYFPDLSPYQYAGREPGTVNIGWLDNAHEFPTGDVPPGFMERIEGFYAHPVNVMRGIHPCMWCNLSGYPRDRAIANAELRITGPERIYAAPSLILHYIEAHHYLPPQEFIEAVMHGPLPDTHEWIQARARILWREPEIVRKIVKEQWFRYRALTAQDAYKLLYQGVMGPGHLVADKQAFVDRLRAEIAALPPVDQVEEVWESIHPDGALARVNLRPYLNAGHSVEVLAEACIQTAALAWGTPDLLRAAWGVFISLCEDGAFESFAPADVIAFTEWLAEHDYPAVHHSDAYRVAYRPAYRVVSRTQIENNLL